MDQQRKTIIVNEIIHWKNTRMLPEQYCDYLLALYTEGNEPEETKETIKRNPIQLFNILFLLFIPIGMFLLYFTELSFILQITFIGLIVFFGIFLFFYYFNKGIKLHIPIITAGLLLLILSVEAVTAVFAEYPLALYLILIFHCLLWMAAGRKFALGYFSLSGILGTILIIVSIFI